MDEELRDLNFMMDMDKFTRDSIKDVYENLDNDRWFTFFKISQFCIIRMNEERPVGSVDTPHINAYNVFYDSIGVKIDKDKVKQELKKQHLVFTSNPLIMLSDHHQLILV